MTRTRNNQWLAVILAALLMVVGLLPTPFAKAEKKSEVKAPDAVLAAFHKAYPKAEIRDISMETKDSLTYFEIESIDGGQRRDLLYNADGTVYEMEERIPVSDLPAKIEAALKAKFPKCKPQKAEKITRGAIVEYEVSIENGEENLEVLLSADGSIKSQASVSDEDEQSESGEPDEPDED